MNTLGMNAPLNVTDRNAVRIDNVVEFPPFAVPATWYPAATPRGTPRATMVLLPALGTGAGYYRPFAEALATCGFDLLSPELPGTGDSRPRASRGIDFGYRDLVERYLPGLLVAARQRSPQGALVVVGHSLGAQVAALALRRGQAGIDALVSVACGHIHFRNWDGSGAARVRLAALAVTTLTRAFGYLPGHTFAFGAPQPRTLMREWSRTIRSGLYPQLPEVAEPANDVPTLAIGFDGDFLAPARSVAAWAAWLGGDMQQLDATGSGHPHFAWARDPVATVRQIEAWLQVRGIAPRD